MVQVVFDWLTTQRHYPLPMIPEIKTLVEIYQQGYWDRLYQGFLEFPLLRRQVRGDRLPAVEYEARNHVRSFLEKIVSSYTCFHLGSLTLAEEWVHVYSIGPG